MGERAELVKLRQVLEYLLSAPRLRKQWFYMAHAALGYTTDLVVALGIGSPLVALATGTGAGDDATTLQEAIGTVPARYYVPALLLVVAWVGVRVAVAREDGEKRAVLAKSCIRSLRHAQSRLPGILQEAVPIPGLNKLWSEVIQPTVDRNVQEGSWPWPGPAPGIGDAVERELASLRSRYETGWGPPNLREGRVVGRREAPDG